jgi:hypothetical protein
MPNLPLNRTFLRQFREGQMYYTMNNELRYQSLNYRQFSGSRNEVSLLYKKLSLNLNDETMVQQLGDKIIKEAIPQARHLSGFLGQLRKICLGNAKQEPYTLPYYSPLLCELKTFATLIDQFQKLVPTRMLSFLDTIKKEKPSKTPDNLGEAEVIVQLRELTLHYLNLFEASQEQFHDFLQKESPEERALMVYSGIGSSMMHLLNITEKLIVSICDTLSLLEKWEFRLNRREKQEIYN